MENEMEPTPEAVSYAQSQLMLVAVRALMESHPNPASFRESWAHCLSIQMKQHVNDFGPVPGYLEDTGAAFRQLLPIWESFFPDSAAAKTKPPFGGTPPA